MIGTCTQALPRVHVVQVIQRATVLPSGSTIDVRTQEVTSVIQSRETVARVQIGGMKGDKGDPGADGAGGIISYPAGESIHGQRAVRVAGGELFAPDLGDNTHAAEVVGIAMQSGTGTISVRTRGPMTEPSWNWTTGFVYCGADGVLTQSPPSSGWLLAVGRAVDATTIDIDIDTPFIRSA